MGCGSKGKLGSSLILGWNRGCRLIREGG